VTATGWQESEAAGHGAFDVTARGYDRRQVDARVAELTAMLAAVDEALQFSRMQTEELTEQLRNAVDRLRQAGTGPQQKDSFGFRVEKILMMAQEEAKEVRAQAGADAASMVEQARAEAAAHRVEGERVRAQAHRDAEMARAQAHSHLAELTARVEHGLTSRRQAAERDLSRLVTARDQVWAELTRMREQLRTLLPGRPRPAAGTPAGAGPKGGAGPAFRWGDHGVEPHQDTGPESVVPTQAGERPSRHRQGPRHTSMSRRAGGEVA
jgi:cell division septum initiation protein DivIVA